MSRILASIQVVNSIKTHPNGDMINISSVLGWDIVTKIGETNIGDKVVYCEIDSLIPVEADWIPEAIKLKIQKDNISNFFRIKTLKIRGVYSQGLIIPMENFKNKSFEELEIGSDLTESLGIKKYDNDISDGVTSNGGKFPTDLIPKTDEKRIQNHPNYLNNENIEYYSTVKLDGTSATYLYNNGEFYICSRNYRLPDSKSVWYDMAKKYQLKEKYESNKIDPKYAFQGEICGPSIQKNLLGLKNIDFFVFNVYDIQTGRRLWIDEMIELCNICGLKHVPVEEKGYFNFSSIEELLNKSKGKYQNTKNNREGLVFRLKNGISFKVINNEYLIKYE